MLHERKALWKAAFGDEDAFIDSFFSSAWAPDRTASIVAEGRLAAALYWLDCEYRGQKLAYIYAVATHPDFRGQGLCRALMERAHGQLARSGYASALLSPAGEGLRAMYRKLGYRDCCFLREQRAVTSGAPCAIRQLSPEEYARLRRQYLPEDGVIQEGENLRFLASWYDFFAGEDFLLAAVREEKNLFGAELLGNAAQTPHILAALDCREGTFRCPGGEIPFAMIHPLQEDAAIPGYLGFAFD